MTAMNAPRPISAENLAARLGRAGAPVLVDVRKTSAFDAARRVIAGALRIAPEDIDQGAAKLPRGREIVVYCVHGHEVSQAAARSLVAAGLDAAFLEGGIAHWEEEHRPTMSKAPELGSPSHPGRPSRWITRERPKVDRIACPWLIHRFIDPMAEFFYVPSEMVMDAAQRENATPYDVPAVRFSHRGDEGERCSFDSFIADFGLDDPALHDLAAIVRGADTGKPELTPQSAGLLAVSLGLSATHEDDHAMLEQGMVVYDALYAWIKSARAEVHNAALFRKSP